MWDTTCTMWERYGDEWYGTSCYEEDAEWDSLEDALEFLFDGGFMEDLYNSGVEVDELEENLWIIRESLAEVADAFVADANRTWNFTEIDEGLAMILENPDMALGLIEENLDLDLSDLDEFWFVLDLVMMCDNATLSEVNVTDIISQAEQEGYIAPGEFNYTNATELCNDLTNSAEF